MALETLKGVTQINGEQIIVIKEVGKNGCQVTDMIAVVKHMLEELNKKFPS